MTTARRPQGTPIGGQFAPTGRPEADIALAPAAGPTASGEFADHDEYVGRNPDIFEAVESLTAERVRESFLEGRDSARDGDPLTDISDRELHDAIAAHRHNIDSALDRIREVGEDDAWAEHDRLCRRVAEATIATKRSQQLIDAIGDETSWHLDVGEYDADEGKATTYLRSQFERIRVETGNGEWAVYDHGHANPDPVLEGTYDPLASNGIAEAAAEIKAGGDPDVGNEPIDGEFFDESWAEQDLRDTTAAMEG